MNGVKGKIWWYFGGGTTKIPPYILSFTNIFHRIHNRSAFLNQGHVNSSTVSDYGRITVN